MSTTENRSNNEPIADKTSARIVGALIIIGYLTYGIPQGTHIQPLLSTADPLASIATDTIQLTIGALIMAINAVAVVGISLFLYPVLKQHNETIALGYIGTRLFECVALIGGVIALLLLVPLSQEYVQASTADTASFEALATLAVQGDFLAYNIAMIGLSIGSLPFCYLLYKTKLVPSWIAGFGLIGYPALLALMLIEIFGFGVGPNIYLLYMPGGIFELGLALWLIVKGFDSSASASKTPSTIGPGPAK